jgi:hypothetical protein
MPQLMPPRPLRLDVAAPPPGAVDLEDVEAAGPLQMAHPGRGGAHRLRPPSSEVPSSRPTRSMKVVGTLKPRARPPMANPGRSGAPRLDRLARRSPPPLEAAEVGEVDEVVGRSEARGGSRSFRSRGCLHDSGRPNPAHGAPSPCLAPWNLPTMKSPPPPPGAEELETLRPRAGPQMAHPGRSGAPRLRPPSSEVPPARGRRGR